MASHAPVSMPLKQHSINGRDHVRWKRLHQVGICQQQGAVICASLNCSLHPTQRTSIAAHPIKLRCSLCGEGVQALEVPGSCSTQTMVGAILISWHRRLRPVTVASEVCECAARWGSQCPSRGFFLEGDEHACLHEAERLFWTA